MKKLIFIIPVIIMFNFAYSQCLGDVNQDEDLNVLDIVLVVGHIIGTNSLDESVIENADYNSDLAVNVLDIVQMVGVVVNNEELECEDEPELVEICENEYNFITGELLNCDENSIEVNNECYMESDLNSLAGFIVLLYSINPLHYLVLEVKIG